MAGDFCGVAGTPATSKGWGCVSPSGQSQERVAKRDPQHKVGRPSRGKEDHGFAG